MNRDIREIRRALDAAREVLGSDHPVLVRLVASVERLEAVKRENRKAAKLRAERVPPAPSTKKAADVDRRLAEIRVELHREANGNCVICGLSLPFARMHAHHILSGPERLLEERQDTMAPTHEKCHDWLHGKWPGFDQRDALVMLLGWCEETKRELAAASTRRRIAKIDEARKLRDEVERLRSLAAPSGETRAATSPTQHQPQQGGSECSSPASDESSTTSSATPTPSPSVGAASPRPTSPGGLPGPRPTPATPPPRETSSPSSSSGSGPTSSERGSRASTDRPSSTGTTCSGSPPLAREPAPVSGPGPGASEPTTGAMESSAAAPRPSVSDPGSQSNRNTNLQHTE